MTTSPEAVAPSPVTDETVPDHRSSSPLETNGDNEHSKSSDNESVHGESTFAEHSATDLISSSSPPARRSSLLSPTSSSGSLSISIGKRKDSLVKDLAATSAGAFLAGLAGLDILSDEEVNGSRDEVSTFFFWKKTDHRSFD